MFLERLSLVPLVNSGLYVCLHSVMIRFGCNAERAAVSWDDLMPYFSPEDSTCGHPQPGPPPPPRRYHVMGMELGLFAESACFWEEETPNMSPPPLVIDKDSFVSPPDPYQQTEAQTCQFQMPKPQYFQGSSWPWIACRWWNISTWLVKMKMNCTPDSMTMTQPWTRM